MRGPGSKGRQRGQDRPPSRTRTLGFPTVVRDPGRASSRVLHRPACLSFGEDPGRIVSGSTLSVGDRPVSRHTLSDLWGGDVSVEVKENFVSENSTQVKGVRTSGGPFVSGVGERGWEADPGGVAGVVWVLVTSEEGWSPFTASLPPSPPPSRSRSLCRACGYRDVSRVSVGVVSLTQDDPGVPSFGAARAVRVSGT